MLRFPEISVGTKMECFGPGRNSPEKGIHLQRWSSLTGRSGPTETCRSIFKNSRLQFSRFQFPVFQFSSPTSLRSNRNFGRNINETLRSGWQFCFLSNNGVPFSFGWFHWSLTGRSGIMVSTLSFCLEFQ